MRISDWSSDVCSSDLSDGKRHDHAGQFITHQRPEQAAFNHDAEKAADNAASQYRKEKWQAECSEPEQHRHGTDHVELALERQNVVWGKSGSVRVDLGGRRIYKKTKTVKR